MRSVLTIVSAYRLYFEGGSNDSGHIVRCYEPLSTAFIQ
jgi:hypothetical protein